MLVGQRTGSRNIFSLKEMEKKMFFFLIIEEIFLLKKFFFWKENFLLRRKKKLSCRRKISYIFSFFLRISMIFRLFFWRDRSRSVVKEFWIGLKFWKAETLLFRLSTTSQKIKNVVFFISHRWQLWPRSGSDLIWRLMFFDHTPLIFEKNIKFLTSTFLTIWSYLFWSPDSITTE